MSSISIHEEFIQKLESDDQQDDFLFHYTKMETALEHILSTRLILAKSVAQMNDLADTAKRSHSMMLNFKCKEKANEIVNDYMEYEKKLGPKETKLICFSETISNDRTQFGYMKHRMWAQYGQGYKGVCLVFSKRSILQEAEKNFQRSMFASGAVEYGPIDGEPIIARLGRQEGGLAPSRFRLPYRQMFFSKDCDWKQESEWRIVISDSPEGRTYFQFTQPVGVILGPKLAKVHYPSFAKIINFNYPWPIACIEWDASRSGLRLFKFPSDILDCFPISPNSRNDA